MRGVGPAGQILFLPLAETDLLYTDRQVTPPGRLACKVGANRDALMIYGEPGRPPSDMRTGGRPGEEQKYRRRLRKRIGLDQRNRDIAHLPGSDIIGSPREAGLTIRRIRNAICHSDGRLGPPSVPIVQHLGKRTPCTCLPGLHVIRIKCQTPGRCHREQPA